MDNEAIVVDYMNCVNGSLCFRPSVAVFCHLASRVVREFLFNRLGVLCQGFSPFSCSRGCGRD